MGWNAVLRVFIVIVALTSFGCAFQISTADTIHVLPTNYLLRLCYTRSYFFAKRRLARNDISGLTRLYTLAGERLDCFGGNILIGRQCQKLWIDLITSNG